MKDTLVTSMNGVPAPQNFPANATRKFLCEIVQGEVSNVTRVEFSVKAPANAFMPAGSIVYVDAATNSATTEAVGIPCIVRVGTENANVNSTFGNSGCGLITVLPLNVPNLIATSVFGGTIAAGDKLYVGDVVVAGGTVKGLTNAGSGDVVGIAKTAPKKHHTGPMGIVFSAVAGVPSDAEESSASE